MSTVSVGGVDLYYERRGSGEPVLLLHGGFATMEMMRHQFDALSATHEVFAFERPGHGRTPDVDGSLSYPQSVSDTLGFLDAMGIDDPHFVGFSDGAIIGFLIALQHPSRIRSFVAISGNLDPTAFVGENDGPRVGALDPARPKTEEPDRTRQLYDALSPDGPGHADVVLEKLYRLWTTEPSINSADLSRIAIPTLVMAGDRDMIRLDHTALIAASIPGAGLSIVPGATHQLLEEKPEVVTGIVQQFLATETSTTAG